MTEDLGHLVDSFLHEVQKLLDCVHIFPAVFLLSSLHRNVDQHIQTGHRQIIQQVDSVAANKKTSLANKKTIIMKIPTAGEYWTLMSVFCCMKPLNTNSTNSSSPITGPNLLVQSENSSHSHTIIEQFSHQLDGSSGTPIAGTRQRLNVVRGPQILGIPA